MNAVHKYPNCVKAVMLAPIVDPNAGVGPICVKACGAKRNAKPTIAPVHSPKPYVLTAESKVFTSGR